MFSSSNGFCLQKGWRWREGFSNWTRFHCVRILHGREVFLRLLVAVCLYCHYQVEIVEVKIQRKNRWPEISLCCTGMLGRNWLWQNVAVFGEFFGSAPEDARHNFMAHHFRDISERQSSVDGLGHQLWLKNRRSFVNSSGKKLNCAHKFAIWDDGRWRNRDHGALASRQLYE